MVNFPKMKEEFEAFSVHPQSLSVIYVYPVNNYKNSRWKIEAIAAVLQISSSWPLLHNLLFAMYKVEIFKIEHADN